MGAKYTASQKAASEKYLKNKTENLQLRVPLGKKSKYRELAKQRGTSLNRLVQDLLDAEIEKGSQ